MNSILALLLKVAGGPDMVYLTALVAANVVLGVAAALATGTFNLAKLANFVEQRLLPVYLAYLAVSILVYGNATLSAVPTAVFLALSARLLSYIVANLTELGIPLPSILVATKPSATPIPLAPKV